METVQDLLSHKGHDVHTVPESCSVYDAIALMDQHNIGALVVVDARGKMAGILTERDYARRVVLRGKSSRETMAVEIMTREVVCVRPDSTIDEAMALMTKRRCRHLPVLERGELCGLISIGDVVRAVIHEKEFVIDQLEHYIAGSV